MVNPIAKPQPTPPELVSHLPDALLTLELPNFKLVYANSAVTRVFGYSPEELVGQPFHLLYPNPSNFEIFVRKLAAVQGMGQTEMRLEQLLKKKDGSPLWTESNTGLIFKEGKLAQLVCIIRDISPRTLLLSTVAHELRGPLAILTGLSGVLMDDQSDIDLESTRRYIELMNKTAVDMVHMLDNLLDVTSFELGQVLLDLETVDITLLLQEQANRHQVRAGQKGITLRPDLPAKPLPCRCDRLKLAQVISNFIDNALKYSQPHTTIELIARGGHGEIWVGVKDEGPGIRPEEQQYLFRSLGHAKVSTRPTAGEPSSGLGLLICKKIIEVHGGVIGLDSFPNQGSTFWFSLPAQLPETNQTE